MCSALSGSSACEVALILAKAFNKRKYFIGYNGSFHESTAGTISVSDTELSAEVREKIGKRGDVIFVPYPNCYRLPYSDNPVKADPATVEKLCL